MPILRPQRDRGIIGAMSETNVSNETPTIPAPPPAEALDKPKGRRGFASMDRSQVAAIASKGGRAAHAAGTAHTFTSEEAQAAGKKGGNAPHIRRGRGPVAAP